MPKVTTQIFGNIRNITAMALIVGIVSALSVSSYADNVQNGIYQTCLQSGSEPSQSNNEAFCQCYAQKTASDPQISAEIKQKLTQQYPKDLNKFMGGKISIGGADPKSIEAGELLKTPFECLKETGAEVKPLPAKSAQGPCSPDGKFVSHVGPNGAFDSLCQNGQWVSVPHH